MRVDNQPYGRLNEIIYDQAFTVHPYKHPTIGSMQDLEAASIDDVRDFYQHLLRAEQRDAGARRRLRHRRRRMAAGHAVPRPRAEGRARRCRATSRRSRRRPRRSASRCEEPWPLPAVVVAYHITYDGHPDSYPLHIASKVLSDGQSSRIYRKLVYEKQLALAAFGGAQHHRGSEPVLRRRDRAAGAHAGGGDRRADRRARSAARPSRSAEHELQRAKNQFARDYILGRESNQEKARQLAHAVVIHNDIKTADGEFDIFQNITAGRRAARRADLLHAGEPAGADDHAEGRRRGGEPPMMRRARSRWLCRLLALASSRRRSRAGADWPSERPPRPLPARDVKFPPYADADAAERAAGGRRARITSSRRSACG